MSLSIDDNNNVKNDLFQIMSHPSKQTTGPKAIVKKKQKHLPKDKLSE